MAKGGNPHFEPKKNHAGKGPAAWAKIAKLRREHPGRFYRACKAKTTVEATFSAIKDWFVYCIWSVTIPMQERELATVSICRNVGA